MINNLFGLPHFLSRPIGVTKFFYITSIFFLTSIFISCDEASVVGLDVQPESDLLHINYVDTLTLITQTVKEDSLKTDESILIDQSALLGKYIDPNFGATSSSIYTSLKLSTTITSGTFGSDPSIDSVILSLAYDTTLYGKKDKKTQSLNIYQLNEKIDIDKVYTSNNTISKSSYLLGTKNFIPQPIDSVLVAGKKEKPQLRIKLDNNFGQVILNNQSTGALTNNTTVADFIKGFYITSENTNTLNSGEGNIFKLKMGESKLKLYFHYTGKKITNPSVDSIIYKTYDFEFSGVARFLSFSHDYTGGNVDAALSTQLNSNTFQQNSTTYIQSLSGVKTKVKFPWLKNLNDSGAVSINKAELIIKADQSPSYFLDSFAAPKSLILFGINNDSTTYVLPDAYEGGNYYGGSYNNTDKEYRFNIARYVQQILNGTKENNGIYILASSGAINANRVVIGGGGPGTYQMKLKITYTKLH